MRHLMSPLDFSVEELDKLLDLASGHRGEPEEVRPRLRREEAGHPLLRAQHPRTRLSHEAAMLNLGRQHHGLFFRRLQLRRQRRERVRHHPHHLLLRGHLRHAPPQRRAPPWWPASTLPSRSSTPATEGHQHPDPDPDGPDDDPLTEGASGQHDHRPVRRPEVRPHGPLPHPRPRPLSGHEVRAHLPGGAAAPRLHPARCPGEEPRALRGGGPPGGGASRTWTSST